MSRSITDFSDCQPSVEKSVFTGMENMIILEHGGDMVYLNPSTIMQAAYTVAENDMKESCLDPEKSKVIREFLER
jgi:hypothetical protein